MTNIAARRLLIAVVQLNEELLCSTVQSLSRTSLSSVTHRGVSPVLVSGVA